MPENKFSTFYNRPGGYILSGLLVVEKHYKLFTLGGFMFHKYFIEKMDIEHLRREYHRLCIVMHPDKGGDHEEFCRMKAEYEEMLPGAIAGEDPKRGFTMAYEREIMEMIEKLMNIPGIIIDICGSWLWISGNTMDVRENLKALSFRFSGKKKNWYWSPYRSNGKRRGRYTMEQIYNKFGRETIETEDRKVHSIAA